MNTPDTPNTAVTLFIVIIAILIVLIIGSMWFVNYKHELHYLNLEINRTTGIEKRYWQKQKRTLWYKVLLNIFK